MPKFLNRLLFHDSICELIDNAVSELVIFSAYNSISEDIYNRLKAANGRGVETVFVFRKNDQSTISEREKEKLLALDNLMMAHQNLHSKCYYNGSELIIGSMNLYEFSHKNNREMGVLFKKPITEHYSTTAISNLFEDALTEVNDVITSADMLRESRDTRDNGFYLYILRPDSQRQREDLQLICRNLNRVFRNKNFEPVQKGRVFEARCKNYFDNIDVVFEERRFAIQLNFNENHLRNMRHRLNLSEYKYPGFKTYWNERNLPIIHIYLNGRLKGQEEERAAELKKGLHWILEDLKPLTIK